MDLGFIQHILLAICITMYTSVLGISKLEKFTYYTSEMNIAGEGEATLFRMKGEHVVAVFNKQGSAGYLRVSTSC